MLLQLKSKFRIFGFLNIEIEVDRVVVVNGFLHVSFCLDQGVDVFEFLALELILSILSLLIESKC